MMRFFGRKERTQEGVRRTRETWFGRIAQLFQGDQVDEALWDELEETLISADLGVATTQAIIQRTREALAQAEGQGEGSQALAAIKREMEGTFREVSPALGALLEPNGTPASAGDVVRPKPVVVLVVGVNGSGKTTSVAKLAHYFQEGGDGVLLGAADTFRAAAIEQLQVWGKRLNVDVVANQPGGDPAAVAFDALKAAKARGADVVLIDTAGRLHTKSNLMEELKKIQRVLKRLDESAPHLTILVLDATTGQNGLAQARAFTDAVACDGILMAKLDGTAKGGILFSIQRELDLPVLFIGTGEGLEDLSPFDPHQFVEALFGAPTVSARA